ncbi:hypothetical protein FGO68_gene9254 [Halteria grandinella]|uniref:NAD(P)-binding domain-containing protein n=1 Tax=Halteria grandinella TaxID=5974 RepID=A0A8J8NJQ7_HALGN|nr:hypothetical protein FGO68_gene9254 [Halteria grandinella]
MKVKIALLGATGAIGKEIMKLAKKDPRIEELCVVVRRRLDTWKDEEFQCKLKVIQMESLDSMEEHIKDQFVGYDGIISTMGCLSKMGETEFRKVEIQYPSVFAKSALSQGVKYFGILTSGHCDANSMFILPKIKGEIERDFVKFGFPHLAYFRAGLITDREEARTIEKVLQWVPFIPKITAPDLGRAILDHAIETALKIQTGEIEQNKHHNVQHNDMIRHAAEIRQNQSK